MHLSISHNTISPDLARLKQQTQGSDGLKAILGRAGANTLKKHYREVNSLQANKLGGTRTNFWSRVAQSVQNPQSTTNGISVSISHPAIQQKVYGGEIRPKKAKHLAIPIAPEAHGKSPRSFPNLKFLLSKQGNKLLGMWDNGEFKPLFVLKKSVQQAAEPLALPKQEVMHAALEKAARIWKMGKT